MNSDNKMKKIFCFLLVITLSFVSIFAEDDPFSGNVFSNDSLSLDFTKSDAANLIVSKKNRISEEAYHYEFDDESIILFTDEKEVVNFYDYKLKGNTLSLVDENGSKIKLSKGGEKESLLTTIKEKTNSVVESAKELYNEQPESVKNALKGAAIGGAVGATGSLLFKKKFLPSAAAGAATGAVVNWFRGKYLEKN